MQIEYIYTLLIPLSILCMKKYVIIWFLVSAFIPSSSLDAQENIHITIDAAMTQGIMPPIWRDKYEVHLLAGYGMDPRIFGPHQQFITDPAFNESMAQLKPRYIRISLGRMDNPPDTNYFSTDIPTLRRLPYEFYTGACTMAAADNPANYNFGYIDSMLRVIQRIGALPFITMDYMPYTLSADTIPDYNGLISPLYYLGYNNSIRNSPPRDYAVYGRVIYQLIRHCYTEYGATYFEHWNEPDQQWLNPVFAHFFWTGDEYQLYRAYASIAKEVATDTALANHIKLGGCSFAFYSLFNLVPIHFLDSVRINKDKFDFLSFHPYSDTQWRGGYDTTKAALAVTWRNTYAPKAELINAEWGRLDPGAAVWGDLDYGLDQCSHIIDMLDRGIAMSHVVSIFDAVASDDDNTTVGMYRVGPIVAKPNAFVACNMNRMNDVLNRIPVKIDPGWSALAGKNNADDKIVIILPAFNPGTQTNTISLTVNDIRWNQPYSATRFELTEESFRQGIIFNQTKADTLSGPTFSNTITYPAIDSSGRLIIWEIKKLSSATVNSSATSAPMIKVFPNPTNGYVYFSQSARFKLYDVYGQQISENKANHINLSEINTGTFYLIFFNNQGQIIQCTPVIRY